MSDGGYITISEKKTSRVYKPQNNNAHQQQRWLVGEEKIAERDHINHRETITLRRQLGDATATVSRSRCTATGTEHAPREQLVGGSFQNMAAFEQAWMQSASANLMPLPTTPATTTSANHSITAAGDALQ